MKVHAALVVSWPPINKPRMLSAIADSFMYCPISSQVRSMWDRMSCVGDAFPSARSDLLCLTIESSSFLTKFDALIARLNGVPGKSIGIDMIPAAMFWNGSDNLSTWIRSSRLTNNRHASENVKLKRLKKKIRTENEIDQTENDRRNQNRNRNPID